MTAPTATPRRGGPSRTGGRAAAVVAATLAGLVVGLAGFVADAATGPDPDQILGPGVETVTLDVRHSRFDPDQLTVRAGTTVEFVVVNRDPIHHELIVGPPEVHEIHEHGDHHRHPPIEGEVSVGPHATGSTFHTFEEPGTVTFACHLPGHVAHGMVGTVEVVR